MTFLLKHPLMIVVITVIALFYYLSLDKSARKASISSETVATAQKEIDQMNGEISVLKKQLEAVNQPLAQEKVIRNELLMQKPGEYVLQIPDMEVSEARVSQAEEKTPWEEWKEILF